MGTTKAVIDTNVIISAFGWRGTPFEILQLVKEGKIMLLISEEQILELERVLKYPKLNFQEQMIEERLNLVISLAQLVNITNKIDIIKEDPADNVILETAIEHNADYIITGDKHLLKLKKYENVKIVTPKEFLSITST